MAKICIGIPCFSGVPPEILEDYMSFAYKLGKEMAGDELFLAIKGKSEQFRARNAIVVAALQQGCDYLFFLDDDHILSGNYDIILKLINQMEEQTHIGIIGALYYQRKDGATEPVVMKKHGDGGYISLRRSEILGKLQPVDVTGGGCMLVNMRVFDKIKEPWFAPEHKYGTDIQLCEKVKEAGYEVLCDTSIVVGHLLAERMLVSGPCEDETCWVQDYKEDVLEYLQCSTKGLARLCLEYDEMVGNEFPRELSSEALSLYYKTRPKHQVARNAAFHLMSPTIAQSSAYIKAVSAGKSKGLDFGCGTAPIGFELARFGHEMTFVDQVGSGSYDFLLWRLNKYNLEYQSYGGDYDFVLLMDIIEHMEPNICEITLEDIVRRMKPGGLLFTNYFRNEDFANIEHINMDHDRWRGFFRQLGLFTFNEDVWAKPK